MPALGTIEMGKFDQRLRCCSSSNANVTLFRCFSSSVERNVFAALTMRDVAVCAIRAFAEMPTRARAPKRPSAALLSPGINSYPILLLI